MWKIAIIDDDRRALLGMKNAIPWAELDAECAGEAMNGADGLELIRAAHPDIIITDIYMPVLNGLDMIEQLRQDEFNGKIIILSGYSDFEYARQALRLNVSDYLSKPVSLPTLKSILAKAIQELTEEEQSRIKLDELQQRLMLYEPFIEKEWVKSAVAGTLDGAYRKEDLLPAPYRFWLRSRHAVVGVDIVRDARVSALSLSDWSLFRFAVSNIACEVAREFFSSTDYTELHSTRAALIIHLEQPFSGEQLQHRLLQMSAKLIECTRSYLHIALRIGLGQVKEHWSQIPDSTEEAFRAIDCRERRLAAGSDVFAYCAESQSGKCRVEPPPVKFYLELAGAIKESREPHAREIVARHLAGIKPEHAAPEDIQVLAGEMWAIIAYCLYEVGMVLDDLFPGGQIAQEMAGLGSPKQLSDWLAEKISVICSSRLWKGNSKHRQAVDFVIQYVHERYAEDITIADLSDKVFISRNYLSIIFKNLTGETFNTYLTRVRIEKARELLLERNMLVYEVAEKVGYKNVPYFSTLFKKFTGMNPTELAK